MGLLSFKNGKFIFGLPLTKDDELTILATGFIWNASTSQWETRNPHKAAKLRAFADPSAELKLKNTFFTLYECPEQIIYPDHLQPHTFQIESAFHICTRTPVYNADEAGLGKTITAILCMNTIPGNVLVICPPYLKQNWWNELNKWLVPLPAREPSVVSDSMLTFREINVVSDSMLTNKLMRATLLDKKFEWLFVDEAHRYKEATAQRTKSLLGDPDDDTYPAITSVAKRIVYLSGTPIPNGRPIELYPLLSRSAFEAIQFRSLAVYGQEFCGGKSKTRFEGGRPIVHLDFKGSSNLKKLRTELREKFMIRHLKKNVLEELGPKTRQIIFLDKPKHIEKFEQSILKNYTLDELMGENHTMGDIATYRKEVGHAKMDVAFTYIHELLETTKDKYVVFAHHIEVVEGLTRMLAKFHPLMVRGGLSSKEKAKRVQLFQTVDKHRLIIGNMGSMGIGNTLTKSPGVIIVEASWSPSENEQAEDRVHRLTQNGNVYCRYLVLRNSLDERMLSAVLNKQKSINQVMD